MAVVRYKGNARQVLYTCSEVEELIGKYYDLGGECYELEEGCLGYGLTVCCAPGYKAAVITEVALNEWESAHKVRMYNRLPEKYEKMIENMEEETA